MDDEIGRLLGAESTRFVTVTLPVSRRVVTIPAFQRREQRFAGELPGTSARSRTKLPWTSTVSRYIPSSPSSGDSRHRDGMRHGARTGTGRRFGATSARMRSFRPRLLACEGTTSLPERRELVADS